MHDVATKMAIVCVVVVLAFFITGSTASSKYEDKQKVCCYWYGKQYLRFLFAESYISLDDLVVKIVRGRGFVSVLGGYDLGGLPEKCTTSCLYNLCLRHTAAL